MRYLISLVLVTTFSMGFSQSRITDDRDGTQYEIVKLGSVFWMKENLRFNAEGSICKENCYEIRFYDYRNLDGVCPANWRLPTMDEWNEFTESFTDAEKARMMESNPKLYRVDFLDRYDIFENNVLDIRPFGRVEGGEVQRNKFIDYWATNSTTKDERFHMHLTPYSIVGHGHKHHLKSSKPEEFRLFPIRCVCEEEKVKSSDRE